MYVGRRINPPNPNERTGPGAVEVDLVFYMQPLPLFLQENTKYMTMHSFLGCFEI